MLKSLAKFWPTFFLSAAIAFGLMTAFYFFVGRYIGYGVTSSLVFGGVVLLLLIQHLGREQVIKNLKAMSYESYKASHPDNVRGNRVTCFHCGGDRINIRSLMNHLYHREHICVQCGKTLYYSPEQR